MVTKRPPGEDNNSSKFSFRAVPSCCKLSPFISSQPQLEQLHLGTYLLLPPAEKAFVHLSIGILASLLADSSQYNSLPLANYS